MLPLGDLSRQSRYHSSKEEFEVSWQISKLEMNLNFFGSSVVRSVEFLSANETPDLMSNFLLNVGGLHLIASGATGFLARVGPDI